MNKFHIVIPYALLRINEHCNMLLSNVLLSNITHCFCMVQFEMTQKFVVVHSSKRGKIYTEANLGRETVVQQCLTLKFAFPQCKNTHCLFYKLYLQMCVVLILYSVYLHMNMSENYRILKNSTVFFFQFLKHCCKLHRVTGTVFDGLFTKQKKFNLYFKLQSNKYLLITVFKCNFVML